MRLISFALTTAAILEMRKFQTRRLGWLFAKRGDVLAGVRKAMGRRKGEPLEYLAVIELVEVRRERLDDITDADVIAEGFPEFFVEGRPGLAAQRFVAMFCEHMKCDPATEITVLDFAYRCVAAEHEMFVCPECKSDHVGVDEDWLCLTCGADCYAECCPGLATMIKARRAGIPPALSVEAAP